MQAEISLHGGDACQIGQMPASYQWSMGGFVISLAMALLALVDFRRGFLLDHYAWTTLYFSFSPWHIALLAVGLLGAFASYRVLRASEVKQSSGALDRYVKVLTFVIFGLFVTDLFAYRGVAAARAAEAGQLSAGWMNAYGVTGWLKPLALAVSYQLTVWHATFLGIMLAGLALTVLPRYLKPLLTRSGLGGSLFGAAFALPQPFCSCCASVVTPSLVRQGASSQFALAFVVGSPMLNLTALILAAVLLPPPYALLRITAGLALTIPVTYGVVWVASRWQSSPGWSPRGRVGQVFLSWMNGYCQLFHVEEMMKERRTDTPAAFIASWFSVTKRLALLLVPTLFILSLVTSAIIQMLPSAFGNNLPSVAIAAVAGTLLMVSTWTEIPVAQQMLQAGFSGPAATLLVVLPPVSLPCLMLLGGALANLRAVALLGLTVAALGAVVGVAFL
ncbi:MAG: permease [Chloroflexi bacterium]|nr:permease [Chloroflexota bacterium]